MYKNLSIKKNIKEDGALTLNAPLGYVGVAKNYIENNYMNSDISVRNIASLLHINRAYLYRLFKIDVGVSVKEYIIKIRMLNAKKLLKTGNTIGETALLVGYKDAFVFSRAFKKYVGISPKEYKEK